MSGGSVKRKVEGSSGVSDKGASGERVVMEEGPITMGVYILLTVRVVIAIEPIARGVELVLGSAVESVPGYYELRLALRCSGAA